MQRNYKHGMNINPEIEKSNLFLMQTRFPLGTKEEEHYDDATEM